mgnify:CR=1 FL=1
MNASRFTIRTLRSKLLLAFGSMAVVIAATCLVSIWLVQEVDEGADEMYDNMTVPLAQLAQLNEDYQRIRINLRDMVFARSQEEEDAFAETIYELAASIDETSRAFEERIGSDEMKEAYDEFDTARAIFVEERDNVMALAREGGREADAIALLFGASMEKAQATMAALRTVKEMKLRHAEERRDLNNAVAERARLIMTIALVLGFALAIAMGLFIARMIARPVAALAGAAGRAAAGDLDVLVDVKTGDEVGRLAAAFNEMITQVRQSVDEVQQKSRLAESAQASAEAAQVEAQAQQAYLSRSVDTLLGEMNRFADGDLTVHVEPERAGDEIGQLFAGFNRAAENLRGMILQVSAAVELTASASAEI